MWLQRIVIFCIVFTFGCSKLPADANDTLEHIQANKVIKIGVVINPPWTFMAQGELKGPDVQLMQNFAQSLHVTPEFQLLGYEEAILALQSFAIDVVIGGLTESIHGKEDVGYTRPYYTETFYIGTKNNNLKKKDLVHCSSPMLYKFVARKGYKPVSRVNTSGLPLAAASWQLQAAGYELSKKIYEQKHIFFIPKGENKFLIRLEQFIIQHDQDIPILLSKVANENNHTR